MTVVPFRFRVLEFSFHEHADTYCALQADQIAELYDLLTFHDKPAEPRENGTGGAASGGRKSVHDVMRMVKESLGEEAMNRLEQDGLGYTTRRRAHKVL
jgi:catechol 2,3-dioxygenase-like lactoylglutathione lyase family enzyme